MSAVPVTASTAQNKATKTLEDARAKLRSAEVAFAATMARRDLSAFAGYIAEDAVFINGGQPLRGKSAIVAEWAELFAAPVAPFAWQPDIVEVSAGGAIGYTEGPVTVPSGRSTVRFFSTWQLKSNGQWLIVFDNGYAICKE
jgi:ketosteroid isomerase-like protein